MPAAPALTRLFVTKLYRAEIAGRAGKKLNRELDQTCRVFAEDDAAGRRWSAKSAYPGYTSYASLNDLPARATAFADLKTHLDRHAARFAKALDFDLGGKKFVLDSLWINVLEPGGFHTGHIHPHSVISGTYYVSVPDGAGALKLEDPRHPFMMAAPPRKKNAPLENQAFHYIAPEAGTLLMWESWLRHEVPLNQAESERISISFNFTLE